MKKIKLSSHQIKFAINMLSLAVFVFSYLYIYNGLVKKEKEANKEIQMTETAIKNRKNELSKEDAIRQETKEILDQVQEILDRYPVNITKVDNLLFVDRMQKELNISFNTISPSDSTPFFQTALPIRNSDGTEVIQVNSDGTNTSENTEATKVPDKNTSSENKANESKETDSLLPEDNTASEVTSNQPVDGEAGANSIVTMQGLQSSITMNFQTTYQDFKKLTEYIANYPDQTVIDSVSVSSDNTTGKLTGSLVLKRFALSGTGKVYEVPLIDNINVGTDNIFGTDKKKEDKIAPTDGQ